MARQALTLAGAAIGAAFGAPRLGFMLGSLVGNLVDPVVIKGPKIEAQPQTSRDGVPINRVYGTAPVTGTLLDRGEPIIKKIRKRQGKGGPVTEEQRIYLTHAIMICEGEIEGVARIWEDEKLVYDVRPDSELVEDSAEYAEKFTLYLGTDSQTPDPDLELIHGVGTTPNHKRKAYVVFPRKDVTDRRGTVPQYRFEVAGRCVASTSGYWSESDQSSAGEPAYGVALTSLGKVAQLYNTTATARHVGVRAAKTHTAGVKYFELLLGSVVNADFSFGVSLTTTSLTSVTGAGVYIQYYDGTGFTVYKNGTSTTAVSGALTAADVIGFACDLDNDLVYIYKNGTYVAYLESTECGFNGQACAPWIKRGNFNNSASSADTTTLRLLDSEFTYSAATYGATEWGIGGSAALDYDTNTTTLDEVVTHLCGLVDVETAEIDVTELTDTVRGFVVNSDTVKDNIQALQTAYLFDCVEFDGKINFIKRGGASAVSIPEDDLLEDPEEMTRQQELEFPKKLHLYYTHPRVGYVPTKATSSRITPDLRVTGEQSIQLPVTFTEEEAARKCDVLHKVAWVDLAGEVKFRVGTKYAYLVPSDIVTVTVRSKARRLRIEKIERVDNSLTITAKHDRASAYSSSVNGQTIRDPLTPVSSGVGDSLFEFLDIPALNSDDSLGYRVAVAGTLGGWRGAQLQRSIDAGVSFDPVASIAQSAVIGELTAALPIASAYVTDNTNTLAVEILTFDDELETVTETQLLQDYNAAVIFDGTDYEIVQFKTATEPTANNWNLTSLLRGRLATTPATWAIGSKFVMLDTTDWIATSSTLLDLDLTHRAVSLGKAEDSANEYTDEWTGRSQQEFAPLYLSLARDMSDVITGTWVPRWRFGTSANPIQSAHFLGWRVTFDDGVLPVVTVDVTTPEITYDASALGASVTVTVAGINRYTGAGLTASDSI